MSASSDPHSTSPARAPQGDRRAARGEPGYRYSAYVASSKAHAEGLRSLRDFPGRSVGTTTVAQATINFPAPVPVGGEMRAFEIVGGHFDFLDLLFLERLKQRRSNLLALGDDDKSAPPDAAAIAEMISTLDDMPLSEVPRSPACIRACCDLQSSVA
ncbi:MAG: hypothetical protein HC793_01275 [Aquincola sp.]|nr:hypothetical protein [Aquincola sp.]